MSRHQGWDRSDLGKVETRPEAAARVTGGTGDPEPAATRGRRRGIVVDTGQREEAEAEKEHCGGGRDKPRQRKGEIPEKERSCQQEGACSRSQTRIYGRSNNPPSRRRPRGTESRDSSGLSARPCSQLASQPPSVGATHVHCRINGCQEEGRGKHRGELRGREVRGEGEQILRSSSYPALGIFDFALDASREIPHAQH